jgi:hypothetical protein
MINFIKKIFNKWFGKKEKPLFDEQFIERAKKIIERPSNQPYSNKIKSLVIPQDLSLYSSLEFDKEDISTHNLSLLSKEAQTKIISIIKEDTEKRIKESPLA